MSIETEIVDKIVEILGTVPGINYISFDKIKLTIGDFQQHELPAVQLWDVGQVITHVRGRIQVEWSLSLELIMRSDFHQVVDQRSLFEKRREIQLALWAEPNLNIPGVIHMVYTGNASDLHMLDPFYIARIDFNVLFYDSLVSTC